MHDRGVLKKKTVMAWFPRCMPFLSPFPFPSLVLVFIYHKSSPGTSCHWCGTSHAANIFCWRLNLFELEALCNKTMSGFWCLSPPSNFHNMQHLPLSLGESIINIPLASFLTLGPRINKKKTKNRKALRKTEHSLLVFQCPKCQDCTFKGKDHCFLTS